DGAVAINGPGDTPSFGTITQWLSGGAPLPDALGPAVVPMSMSMLSPDTTGWPGAEGWDSCGGRMCGECTLAGVSPAEERGCICELSGFGVERLAPGVEVDEAPYWFRRSAAE